MGYRWMGSTLSFFGVVGSALFTPNLAYGEVLGEVARAQAEFIRIHGQARIVGIRLEGLKRTRQAVVEQWIDCDVGSRLSDCDWSIIRDRLFRLAIFGAVDVEFDAKDDGV